MIFLPKNTEPSKVEALKGYNVSLSFYGNDPLTTELHAKKVAEEKNTVWVSPYNDPDVIAGQGTIAFEVTENLSGIDTVFGCVGGGGMMSGVSSWFKSVSRKQKSSGVFL